MAKFPRIVAQKAVEICQLFELGPEAAKLLDAEVSPPDFLARLMGQELYHDAIRLLAFGLPKREAVWWAYYCAKQAYGDTAPPPVEAVLAATETWVREPTDPNRRAAFDLAEKAGFDNPASCAAMAAFFSGGSISPEGQPEVQDQANVTPKAASGGIILAGVLEEPEKAAGKYKIYLGMGVRVAERPG
jgi:hypothetical protein